MSFTLPQIQPLSIPKTAADWAQFLTSIQQWQAALTVNADNYNSTFSSGQLLFVGPGNRITGTNQMIYGAAIPTPSSPYPTGGAALLLGSGGGNGTPISFWIVQDAPFDDVTPGNNLGLSAGESDGAMNGGTLTGIGGASASGRGGTAQWQGGTSASGPGGFAIVQGGNSTTGAAGDAFLTGGQAGTAGANVHLIATLLNGVSGVIRMRQNSEIMADFVPIGSASAGSVAMGIYLYTGGGYGLAGQPLVSGGPSGGVSWQAGFTGTIVTASLGTAQGSMTFASGILVSQVAAT